MKMSSFPRLPGLFAIAGAAVIFSSCQKEQPQTGTSAYAFTQTELADLQANTCLAIDPADAGFDPFLPPSGTADERASGLKNKYWTPGQVIRVRFLNGSATLQNKVFAYAEQWEQHANINFQKVSSGTAEVRVLFSNNGHWSYVGKDLLYVPANQQTMNLQFADNTSEAEIKRTTLHEFGHTLGLRHEQQQPLSNIPWNTTAVYAYYAQFGWSQQQVNEQVLNKNTTESSQYTNFDPTSIMEYPVSAALTTNGYSIPWNNQLSATDKSFIGKVYSSQRITVRHAATGYNKNITFWIHGIYHTIKPGESLAVPVAASGNQLAIYEQPTVGGAWVWDNAYAPALGTNYKIVRVGTTNNLKLVAE